MRSAWRPITCAIISTFFVLLLTACGLVIKDPSLFAGGDAAVTVALTGPTTVTLGGQSQYAATVTGSTNAAVAWSVNGKAGGDGSVGSISAKGLYTAPASAPQPSKVTITATSVASPAVSQSLPVALAAAPVAPPSAVTVALSGAGTVTLGASSQYSAAVTGSTNTGVTWSVNGVAGGNATVGSIDQSGLYKAPATMPQAANVTITATSVADPSISEGLAVLLAAPPPVPGGNGSTVTLVLSGPSSVTVGASAQYAATVTGSTNTAVSWSVNGVAGGNATVGSISATGLYIAPANAPQPANVTITATSVADSTVSQGLAVALTAAPVPPGPGVTLVLTGAASITLGSSSQYDAAVTGSANTGVIWTVDGVAGGNDTVGSISTNGLYEAPAVEPGSSTVTITATSAADPSVARSLTVSLVAPPPPPPVVTLTLTGPASVTLSNSSQYSATVKGSANTGVIWSVNGVVGGSRSIGSISTNGLYKAPAVEPGSSKVTITATSAADSSVARSLTVSLVAPPPPPPTVTLTLTGAAAVTLGSSSQYSATVKGSANTGVIWSVNGVVGGSRSSGSISTNGFYKAPAVQPGSSTVTITATSAADPSVARSLTVSLVAPPPPPPTVTLTLTGAAAVTLGSSSQYSATVKGSANTGVIWSVNGVVGGSRSSGSISTNGFYKAPAVQPGSSTVTITATSAADPSVARSLTVSLVAPPPPPPTVTLTLTGAAAVTLGSSSQYSATVKGSANTGVIWSVNGVVGGSRSSGSISTNGFYKAPAVQPGSSTVTITATSAADPSVARSLTVSLVAPPPPPPTVTLTLTGAAAVTLGSSSQYSATVKGSANTGVIWSVNGVVGGSRSSGSISTNGFYKAPAVQPGSSTVTITATSAADPSVARSLTVSLVAPPPPPPTVTLTLTGAAAVTLGSSSQYSATVKGSANTGVIWSVNGVVGGSRSIGSISTNGLYKAPAVQPGSSKVTISATSMADSSIAKSLTVTLAVPPPPPPPVKLALSGASTVTLGTSSRYAATVTGTSDTAVIWSVDGVVGGDRTAGVISASGLYTAPVNPPQSSKVTITATSVADPSVAQSLVVVLDPPTTPSVTLALSGVTTVTLGTSSQYAAIVKGSTNTAVTWSVDGVVGGDPSVGSISPKGLYTAPGTAPQPSKITITATSVADSTVSQSLVVVLDAPQPPNVTLTLGGSATVTWGTSSRYVATVQGSTNTGVTWTVNGVAGGNATDGAISAVGLYTAPASAPQISTVTITATSVADPTIAKSLVVALVPPTSPSPRIPANAISSGPLDASSRWQWNHDAGTPGTSQGTTVYPVSGLSPDNAAREFYMTYSGRGGEIYHDSFATDANATHFVYDVNVYVVDPSQLANLEMDVNSVMADGRTVILGTQCSTYSRSWEYTYRTNGRGGWHSSNIPCDPKKWTANSWHHFQIASHRDANGIATYDWVGVDGVYSNFQNATGDSAMNLGWQKGSLLINFQIDGANSGSGSNTLYTDKLTIYRW